MRIKRTAGIVTALALAAAVSLGAIASAGVDSEGTVTQAVEGTVSPTKLPKKVKKKDKPKAVTLDVAVAVCDGTYTPEKRVGSCQNTAKPPSANRVLVKFDKDFTFNTKGIPTCAQSDIEGTTTQAAKQVCGDAVVGKGAATATLSPNGNPDITDIEVTGFNGEKQGGDPVILLHADADLGGGSSQTTILPGVLKKGNFAKRQGKVYGWTLDVTVPPLAGGIGSILTFNTTVGKGQVASKKGKNYVTATCKDKKLLFGGDFFYNSNPQGVSELNPTDEVGCKPKK